jgi:hypothetical protein
VIDVYKQASCTGKCDKKFDSDTQLGLLSIGFVLLTDCFLRIRSEIVLGLVSTRGLCIVPSPLIANDFIVTGSVCLSVCLSVQCFGCIKQSSR